MSLEDLESRGAAALAADPDLVDARDRGGAAGAPGDADLHVRHHRAAEGRRAAARRLVLGGRRAVRERPDHAPTTCNISGCRCRTRSARRSLSRSCTPASTTYVDGRVDKIVANLGAVRPTLMCAAPRVFEKVYNAAVGSATSAGGAKAKIFTWAVRVGKRANALELAGKRVPAGLAHPAAHRRQARLHEAAGPSRRPDPGARLRLGAAVDRHLVVLRRRRPADLRGLRPDRVVGRQLRQPARRPAHRHRRQGARRPRVQDRRRRRDPAARRAGHARLPQPAGRDRGRVHATTASSAPATSANSTTTAICASPTARKT